MFFGTVGWHDANCKITTGCVLALAKTGGSTPSVGGKYTQHGERLVGGWTTATLGRLERSGR